MSGAVTNYAPEAPLPGEKASASLRHYLAPWYLAYLILGLITSGILPLLLPLMVANSTHNLGRVGYIMGAYNAGLMVAPVLGLVAERFQLFRPVFFGGFAALSIGLGAIPTASDFASWIALVALCGIGAGAVSTVAPLFVVNFAPKPEWNARIGWLQSSSGAGQLAGLLLAGLLLSGPLAYGFWLAAVLSGLAIAIGHLGLPLNSQPHGMSLPPLPWRRLMAGFHAGPPIGGLLHHSHHLQGEALRRLANSIEGEFGRFLLAWAALNFAVAPFFAYYPLVMESTLGIAPARIAFLYALAAAAGIGLFVATGRVAQQIGSRSVFLFGIAVRAAGFALLAALTATAPTDRPIVTIFSFVLLVLSWPILSVSATGLAARLTPVGEGAAMGLLTSSSAVATVLGTALAGPVVEALGYQVISPIAVAGLLGAAALSMKIRKNRDDKAVARSNTMKRINP